ncbi:hypothetical protein EHW66_20225 [Erwinia psidii]|nr:hypothetical protein [Erwinia psidii]
MLLNLPAILLTATQYSGYNTRYKATLFRACGPGRRGFAWGTVSSRLHRVRCHMVDPAPACRGATSGLFT